LIQLSQSERTEKAEKPKTAEALNDDIELSPEELAELVGGKKEQNKIVRKNSEGKEKESAAEVGLEYAKKINSGNYTDADAEEFLGFCQNNNIQVSKVAKLVEETPDGQLIPVTDPMLTRNSRESPILSDSAKIEYSNWELWDEFFPAGESIRSVLLVEETERFTEIVETFHDGQLESAIKVIYAADGSSVFAALFESKLLTPGGDLVSDKKITEWVVRNEDSIEAGKLV
jgi:hypothetical protein